MGMGNLESEKGKNMDRKAGKHIGMTLGATLAAGLAAGAANAQEVPRAADFTDDYGSITYESVDFAATDHARDAVDEFILKPRQDASLAPEQRVKAMIEKFTLTYPSFETRSVTSVDAAGNGMGNVSPSYDSRGDLREAVEERADEIEPAELEVFRKELGEKEKPSEKNE